MKFITNNLMYKVLFVLFFSIVILFMFADFFQENEEKEIINSDEIILKESVNIPILMYHHIIQNANNEMTITPELFEEHIKTILRNGYVPVSIEEIINFVEGSGDLPDKSICITFDDGYLSNYEIAFPILKKYNVKAAIAIVGSTVGSTTYKDTGIEIISHFDFEHAKEMEESGLVTIISHTYDMHQVEYLESGDKVRISIGKLENETEEEYKKALSEDFEKISTMMYENLGKDIIAVAYPRGVSDEIADNFFKEVGVKLTLATTNGVNKIERGNLNSIYKLNRYTIHEGITTEKLLELINN